MSQSQLNHQETFNQIEQVQLDHRDSKKRQDLFFDFTRRQPGDNNELRLACWKTKKIQQEFSDDDKSLEKTPESRVAYNSDDSVYEQTNQEISNYQHPLLRVNKLSKRISKDKHLGPEQRKSLKARRNLIMNRLRQKRGKMLEEMHKQLIPAIQTKVSIGTNSSTLVSRFCGPNSVFQ